MVRVRWPVQSWFAAMYYFLVMKLKYKPLCN
nr:MAG TPA: NLRC4 helical domain HD2 [Bacteriophage sp.]